MAEKKFSVSGDQYREVDRKMTEIKRQLSQKKGSPLDPVKVSFALQQVIEGRFASDSDLEVTVDYSQSLKEMVDAGNYDYADELEGITITGKGKKVVRLAILGFEEKRGNHVREKEIVELIEKADCVPGSVEHLLALGAAVPDLQRRFKIAVLTDHNWFVDGATGSVMLCSNHQGERFLVGGQEKPTSPVIFTDGIRILTLRKGTSY